MFLYYKTVLENVTLSLKWSGIVLDVGGEKLSGHPDRHKVMHHNFLTISHIVLMLKLTTWQEFPFRFLDIYASGAICGSFSQAMAFVKFTENYF